MLNIILILKDSPHTGKKVIEDFDQTVEMGEKWVREAGYSTEVFDRLVSKWADAINNYYANPWFVTKGRVEDAYRNLQSFLAYGFHTNFKNGEIITER